ncbi:hypothetical protein BJ742DRAFT_827424 [Cladochytrium replicatum]|nr:hypothetical protein BJ742DRAFT_827424 [Cladochytrium replicatum]
MVWILSRGVAFFVVVATAGGNCSAGSCRGEGLVMTDRHPVACQVVAAHICRDRRSKVEYGLALGERRTLGTTTVVDMHCKKLAGPLPLIAVVIVGGTTTDTVKA